MRAGLRLGKCREAGMITLATALLFLVSCEEEPIEPTTDQPDPPIAFTSFEVLNPDLSTAATEIALDYLQQIDGDFEQANTAIVQLVDAIGGLISTPTSETLELAKQAWLSAHSAYELTSLHRHFAAQLYDETSGLRLLQLQYQINHWPIVPGYIDYVDGYPDSGIVHDINVVLNAAELREQHGAFDISEVTLGFHVLEFLLWGQASDTDSRPANDYIAITELDQDSAESGFTLEQLDRNRRRQLLTLVADTLLLDYQGLQSLWRERFDTIRLQIERMSGPEAIIVLANAMAEMLREEVLLRSLYPMLNGDLNEGMQSPYSQSTQNAVSIQLSGLERLLLENQTGNGATLDRVFSAVSDEFSEFFYQNFDASKSCLVLLYSNVDGETISPGNQGEIEIVECINLLTNMVGHIERLSAELTN